MSDKNCTTIHVASSKRVQTIDITGEISAFVKKCGISDGVCYIYVPHTTAAVTINENADPDVQSDMAMGLEAIVPGRLNYDHAEGNSPAHIKSSIIGITETIFISGGRLVLGMWQGVFFCEFDGPRPRQVHIKIIEG